MIVFEFTNILNIFHNSQHLIPDLQEQARKPEDTRKLYVVRFSVPSPEMFKKFLPFYLIYRIVSLCLYLFYVLVVLEPRASGNKKVDCVLVQNPPAMPLLAIVYYYCHFVVRFSKGYTPAFVIDWHNLGFSSECGMICDGLIWQTLL